MANEQPQDDSATPFRQPESWDAGFLSFATLFSKIRARKLMVLVVTVSFGLACLAAALLIEPVYRAEVLVSPVAADGAMANPLVAQFSGLAELSGFALRGSGDRVAALATLKSRTLAEAFISENSLLPALFPNDWDADHKQWKSGRSHSVSSAYALFDKTIREAREDRKTGLVTLAIEWHDPNLAAQWANELLARVNKKLQRDAVNEAETTIRYLEDQIAKANVIEVRQALYGLIEMESKKMAVAHAREEFAFRVIDPAVPPEKAVWPRPVLFTGLGLLIGFGLATVIATNRPVRRSELSGA